MSIARLRAHRRQTLKPATLNLVSLMDIFTILVFFLMVNANGDLASISSNVKLPDSTAQQRLKEHVAIVITGGDVLVQGRKVASVNDVLASHTRLIPGLEAELQHQANRHRAALNNPAGFEGSVTIIGDRDLPYALLKRVMYTCQQTDFTKIALAVNSIGASKGGQEKGA